MKQTRLQLFVITVVMITGVLWGIHVYTQRGIVSESTIHTLQIKCSRFKGVKNVLCLRHELSAMIRGTNIGDIMHAVLLDTYHTDDADTVYNSPNCHALAHLVGETAGRESRVSAPQLFAMCGKDCVYGCVHGLFSGLLKKGTLTASKISSVCTDGDNFSGSSIDHEQCIHGIGHGLADYFHNDIPHAISFCDNFGTQDEKKVCWDGVFMEVFGPVVPQESSATAISIDLFADCRKYRVEIRNICMQSVISGTYGAIRELDEALGTCKEPLDEFDSCVTSVEDYTSLDAIGEKDIVRRCNRAVGSMYRCADIAILSFPVMSNLNAQIDRVCKVNGILHLEQCRAYVKEQLERRALYN